MSCLGAMFCRAGHVPVDGQTVAPNANSICEAGEVRNRRPGMANRGFGKVEMVANDPACAASRLAHNYLDAKAGLSYHPRGVAE